METSVLKKILRVALGLFMTVAGIGHLTFQRGEFQAQVPRWLPQDPNFIDFVVLSSGVVEISLGLAFILLVKHQMKIG